MKKQAVITTKDIEAAFDNGGIWQLVRHLEEVMVDIALIKTRGNTAGAARLCGINRGTAASIRDRKRARR